jgi:hypothetical protein
MTEVPYQIGQAPDLQGFFQLPPGSPGDPTCEALRDQGGTES